MKRMFIQLFITFILLASSLRVAGAPDPEPPASTEQETPSPETYHELSHALVAQDLGAIVNEINLDVTAADRGANYIYDRNLKKTERAMILVAGYVGERAFLGIDRPGNSTADFSEARRLYRGNPEDLYPEVVAILEKHGKDIEGLAAELWESRSMTGKRFREILGLPEPDKNHPARRAEPSTYTGIKIGDQTVKIGGKPPWAGDGWNQDYADWQDKAEGPLCFGFALTLFLWGVVAACMKVRSAGHWTFYVVLLIVGWAWGLFTNAYMYFGGPSN